MRRGGKRSLESRIRRGLKRTCESKESFDNIKEAAIRAAFLLFNNGYFNSPYECRNCVKVHLTTKYKWDNESRAALEKFTSEQRFTRADRRNHSLTGGA